MMQGGVLYEGVLLHRRTSPVEHAFRYRLFLLYLDVDRVAESFRGRLFWSTKRPNLAWFRRSDYLGPHDRPLSECVRDLVEKQLGRRPQGPVRLLTHFRYFGIAMNPISLYYCFDSAERLDVVVAEVNNTPWNERHWYVLDVRRDELTAYRASATKALHVSPFLGMDYDYVFELNEPGERLRVRISNQDRRRPHERPIFKAVLEMRQRPINGVELARVFARYPGMTLQVLMSIYYQALRLWWKGAQFFPHPGSLPPRPTPPQAASSSKPANVELANDSLFSSVERQA